MSTGGAVTGGENQLTAGTQTQTLIEQGFFWGDSMSIATRLMLLGGLGLVLAGCDGFAFDEAPSRDIAANEELFVLGAAADITLPIALPTGFVTYEGVVAGDTAGSFSGRLYADMTMNVDFAGGDITGSIDNVDLVNDATGDIVQELTGALALSGTESEILPGTLGATATGQLSGLGVVNGTTTAALALAGAVRTDNTAADTVYGSVAGGMAGAFNLSLSAGEFYGLRSN